MKSNTISNPLFTQRAERQAKLISRKNNRALVSLFNQRHHFVTLHSITHVLPTIGEQDPNLGVLSPHAHPKAIVENPEQGLFDMVGILGS
jgi:hypothetical protein